MDEIQKIEHVMRLRVEREIALYRHLLDKIPPCKLDELKDCLKTSVFGVEAWLVASCSYLGGTRPIDQITKDFPTVMNAARLQNAPVRHG